MTAQQESPLVRDIEDRLARQVSSLAVLLGTDIVEHLLPRCHGGAERLARQVCDPDPRVAAQAVIDLARLVDLDDPACVASPLGVAVAATGVCGEVGATGAARLLGVSRARVYQLIDAGVLERRGGGVSRLSIARRLAQS